jgi:hypothetical protein
MPRVWLEPTTPVFERATCLRQSGHSHYERHNRHWFESEVCIMKRPEWNLEPLMASRKWFLRQRRLRICLNVKTLHNPVFGSLAFDPFLHQSHSFLVEWRSEQLYENITRAQGTNDKSKGGCESPKTVRIISLKLFYRQPSLATSSKHFTATHEARSACCHK